MSDLVDCALAKRLTVARIVIDQPEVLDPRDLSRQDRLAAWRAHGVTPEVLALEDFQPAPGESGLGRQRHQRARPAGWPGLIGSAHALRSRRTNPAARCG